MNWRPGKTADKRYITVPYFELKKEEQDFPPAHFADLDGLLAAGGTMSEELLLKAYNNGIYYWHHPMKHVKWWSPDPRIVMDPGSLEFPEMVRLAEFNTTANTDFKALLQCCQEQYNRPEEMTPAWLSARMARIFEGLYSKGIIHAQEVWLEGRLVGGFFGLRQGDLLFGEYATERVPGAAAFAIVKAAEFLKVDGIALMDMQKETARTDHLEYETMTRVEFIDRCRQAAMSADSKTDLL